MVRVRVMNALAMENVDQTRRQLRKQDWARNNLVHSIR